MTKQELRKIYLQKRSALSESEYIDSSLSISNNFFANVNLTSVKVLHTFLPIEKNREPNTFIIIERIKQEFPQLHISIPKINYVTGALENYYFTGLQQLEKNAWNILEPGNGVQTKADEIDIVLIPLLIFDKSGHRVGYGKGFYDKFLPTCKQDCKRIGLSLYPPVARIDDVNAHDQTLHLVITPNEIFHF